MAACRALRRCKLDEDVRALLPRHWSGDAGLDGHAGRDLRRHHHRDLPAAGALSALYYAERLYQLPIGVIGIAIGTVLLPEMSRRITAGDDAGAMASQRRAFEFTLLAVGAVRRRVHHGA